MKKIVVVIGTRPEAIKCAPIIIAAKSIFKNDFEIKLVSSGQHKEILTNIFDCFDITPDHILKIERKTPNLSELQSQITCQLEEYLKEENPDIVMVQGDTITTLAGAMAAFYQKVPIAYIESGLRSYNLLEPFPEEGHRRVITALSKWHFTPTLSATRALKMEGINRNVFQVGNTVVDALNHVNKIGFKNKKHQHEWVNMKHPNRKTLLVTIHRRENWNERFDSVMNALKIIAKNYRDQLDIIWLSHPNPTLVSKVQQGLGSFENIHIYPPAEYFQLLHLISNAFLVLSDSGGIQEEAPSFNVPVLVARDVTERMDGVNLGCAKLVGTDQDKITRSVDQLMKSETEYNKMIGLKNPYGDGTASQQILNILKN